MSTSFCLKLLSLCAFTLAINNQATIRDCAKKFQFKIHSSGYLYGEIEVVPIDSSFLQLDVTFTIPGSVRNGYQPTIEFSKTNAEAADDILNDRPVRYKILLPDRILPKVKEILVNNRTICATPEVSLRSTVVKIQHTFTVKNNRDQPATAGFPKTFSMTFQPDHPRNGDFVRPTPQEDDMPIRNLPVNFKPATIPKGPDSPGGVQDRLLMPLFDSSDSRDYCGVPTITPQGRIFPWAVAIFQVNDIGLSYKCGGSLISNQHVVTAAHCVMENGRKSRLDEITLVLGKLNIRKWSSKDGSVMVEPNQIHIHPQFKLSHADIAIIKLEEIIEFTKHIRPVCLWNGSAFEDMTGRTGTLVGWEKDETGKLTTSTPVQLSIPIVSRETCHVKTNRTFCAGLQDGTGPCNEDSGSGFVIRVNRRWMLKGVLSVYDMGDLSCDLSHYFVFVDVGKFKKWILSFMQ